MARLTVTAGSGRTARVPSPPTSSSQPPGTTFNLLPGPPTSSHRPKLVSPDHPDTHTHHPPTIRAVLWLVAMSRFSLQTGPGMGLQAGWPGSVGEMARVPGPPWCLCRVLTHPPRHPLHPPPHRPLCMPGTGLRSARPLAGWPRSATAHAHSLSPAHAPSPLGHPLFSDSASVTVEAP